MFGEKRDFRSNYSDRIEMNRERNHFSAIGSHQSRILDMQNNQIIHFFSSSRQTVESKKKHIFDVLDKMLLMFDDWLQKLKISNQIKSNFRYAIKVRPNIDLIQ